MSDALVRPANPADIREIVALVHDLADFERESDQATATEADLHEALFGGRDTPTGMSALWCNVLELVDPPGARLGGIAIWYLTFSTWTGRHGIYLEDLFVSPQVRGHGYGKKLLGSVAAHCVKHNYPRLEWSVLTWNKSAIDFYRSIGGEPLDEWAGYRLTGDALANAARS